MKNIFTYIFLVLLTPSLFAQNEFGLKLDLGLSKFSNSLVVANGLNKERFTTSGNIGLFYKRKIKKKALFQCDLVLSQIRGKEEIDFDFYDQQWNTIGNTHVFFYRQIIYLSLPVYYGININKWDFLAGVRISTPIYSSSRQKGQTTIYGETEKSNVDLGKLLLKKVDIGPTIQVNNNFNQKVSMNICYFHGLTNTLDTDTKVTWKNRQLTIGMNYYIKKNK